MQIRSGQSFVFTRTTQGRWRCSSARAAHLLASSPAAWFGGARPSKSLVHQRFSSKARPGSGHHLDGIALSWNGVCRGCVSSSDEAHSRRPKTAPLCLVRRLQRVFSVQISRWTSAQPANDTPVAGCSPPPSLILAISFFCIAHFLLSLRGFWPCGTLVTSSHQTIFINALATLFPLSWKQLSQLLFVTGTAYPSGIRVFHDNQWTIGT